LAGGKEKELDMATGKEETPVGVFFNHREREAQQIAVERP
jgi:hypothetical protein